MFTKSLALLLLPALAVAQVYGPPPGPATPASGSSSSSTSSTLAVAPTAPASTANQINVRASFLAHIDTYNDKSASRLTLRSMRPSRTTLRISRQMLAPL